MPNHKGARTRFWVNVYYLVTSIRCKNFTLLPPHYSRILSINEPDLLIREKRLYSEISFNISMYKYCGRYRAKRQIYIWKIAFPSIWIYIGKFVQSLLAEI